jgi:lysophospholipase L1-like esterase
MDIFCFGDSITLGEYDTERGGWVDRLKIACMARFVAGGDAEEDCIFNLGIGGETTRMMRARLTNELEARLDPDVRSLVILAYGANDAAEADGQFLVPLDEYVANLSWAIDEARAHRCDVAFVNVTPIAPQADGVPNRNGRLRANGVVARYNEALAELARRMSVELVDVHGLLSAHMFSADGIHPNAEGHASIAARVGERLSAMRRA